MAPPSSSLIQKRGLTGEHLRHTPLREDFMGKGSLFQNVVIEKLDLDAVSTFWKAAIPTAAAVGFVVKGLYTSGKKYNDILRKMDENSAILQELSDSVSAIEQTQREDRDQLRDKHHEVNVRLTVLEQRV